MGMNFVNAVALTLVGSIFFSVSAFAEPKKNTTKSYTDIHEVDFNNFTYSATGCSEYGIGSKPVKVKKGQYEKDKGANKAYFGVVNNKALYGDLTNDGKDEAIIHTACGLTAGNGGSDELYVYTLNNGIPTLLAKLDYKGIEQAYSANFSGPIWSIVNGSVKVAGGILSFEFDAGLPHANPSHIASFKYRIEGNQLVLAEKPARRSSAGQ